MKLDEWDPTKNENDPLILLDARHPGSFDALVAPWGACILNGFEGPGRCVEPPRDGGNYEYAHVAGADAIIPMGLTHADEKLPFAAAINHYAHTGYGAITAAYFEDDRGIWARGDLMPGVTPRDRAIIEKGALSGDWRWIQELGRYRMIASQVVLNPGFRKAFKATGRQFALAASAGAIISTWQPRNLRPIIEEAIEVHMAISANASPILAAIRRVPAGKSGGGQFASGGGASSKALASHDQAKAFIAEHYGGWKNNLTDGEDKALRFYQSPGYTLMNGELRGQKVDAPEADLKRARQATKDLKGAIAKAPPLAKDTTVYRVFSAEQFTGDLKAGSTVSDPGFVSTSLTRDGAGAFGGGKSLVTATIKLPKGTRAGAGSVKELVLPPGSKFRVTSRAGDKVTLELVPDAIAAATAYLESVTPPEAEIRTLEELLVIENLADAALRRFQ